MKLTVENYHSQHGLSVCSREGLQVQARGFGRFEIGRGNTMQPLLQIHPSASDLPFELRSSNSKGSQKRADCIA